MKKIVVILLGMVFFIVVLVSINPPKITFEEAKVTLPEKPNSVPDNVFWVGGVDGGNFIHITKYADNDDLYSSRIYNDYTGDVEYEGILKYSGNEVINDLLNEPDFYQGWDGETLHLSNNESMTIYQDKSLTKK